MKCSTVEYIHTGRFVEISAPARSKYPRICKLHVRARARESGFGSGLFGAVTKVVIDLLGEFLSDRADRRGRRTKSATEEPVFAVEVLIRAEPELWIFSVLPEAGRGAGRTAVAKTEVDDMAGLMSLAPAPAWAEGECGYGSTAAVWLTKQLGSDGTLAEATGTSASDGDNHRARALGDARRPRDGRRPGRGHGRRRDRRPLGAGTAGIETVFFVPVGRAFGAGVGFVLGCTALFASALLTRGRAVAAVPDAVLGVGRHGRGAATASRDRQGRHRDARVTGSSWRTCPGS
jgi:hypothetical protein